MEKNYCLAVDIGASNGRVMLGYLKDGYITVEEIHRFQNGAKMKDGHLCWDIDRLFCEIKIGMKRCADMGIQPVSMGIDCFGIDFALIDDKGDRIGDVVAYRDSRTKGVRATTKYQKKDSYAVAGMVGGEMNSAFQLVYLNNNTNDVKRAAHFLNIPDYLNFLLTGKTVNELTICQTSLLINAQTNDFDNEVIDMLELPANIFSKPLPPTSIVGEVKPEIAKETGICPKVILPPEHDTISASVAVPCTKDCVFISSGTWSMMGAYIDKPIIKDGYETFSCSNYFITDNHYCAMFGITGLWMIQQIKREFGDKYSYDDLCEMAEKSTYTATVDVGDPSFKAPQSMIEALKTYIKEHDMPYTEELGDLVNCAYRSIASKYAINIEKLETFTGKKYNDIYIVGGGSRDPYLNKLALEFTGRNIWAGPAEATAIGNVASQLTALGCFKDLWDAKKAIPAPTLVK